MLIFGTETSPEIFSFHLLTLPIIKAPQFWLDSTRKGRIAGLNHAEIFFTMRLGEPIVWAPRYNFKTFAFFAWWQESHYLDDFLEHPSYRFFAGDWHVRLKLYRRWGQVSELKHAFVDPTLAVKDGPVVAVTLARLKLLQTARFIKWGMPVERQVRDHKGQNMALAGFRPFNTFSTFSMWKSESEMINMVQGKDRIIDGDSHKLSMQEMFREGFHHEFTTMRFAILDTANVRVSGSNPKGLT